jgi:hypothetical protein
MGKAIITYFKDLSQRLFGRNAESFVKPARISGIQIKN